MTVDADVYNQVFQAGSIAGRTSSAAVTSTAAAYPDLQVANLAVSPATGVESGGTIAVSWDDANTGNGAVSGAYTDSLTVINTTTAATLLNTSLAYNSNATAAIAAGSSFPQEYDFQLWKVGRAGQIEVVVTVNANEGVFEDNASGHRSIQRYRLDDIRQRTGPLSRIGPVPPHWARASVYLGQMTRVDWTLANTGSAAANGTWSEQVFYGTHERATTSRS